MHTVDWMKSKQGECVNWWRPHCLISIEMAKGGEGGATRARQGNASARTLESRCTRTHTRGWASGCLCVPTQFAVGVCTDALRCRGTRWHTNRQLFINLCEQSHSHSQTRTQKHTHMHSWKWCYEIADLPWFLSVQTQLFSFCYLPITTLKRKTLSWQTYCPQHKSMFCELCEFHPACRREESNITKS